MLRRAHQGATRPAPAFAAAPITPLLLITCRLPICERRFLVCSRCYRGHKYCSDACAAAARAESIRKAKVNYAGSDKDRASCRERSRRRYVNMVREKSLTDQASRAAPDSSKMAKRKASKKKSARARHVERYFFDRSEIPDAGQGPQVRCLWCGEEGTHVFHNRRRFAR
jgi:hypothetical protein